MKLARRSLQYWIDLPVRTKGLVVMALPLCAFLLTTFLLYRAKQNQTVATVLLRHTIQVRTEIRDVRESLMNAEAYVRAYDLSGDAAWLQEYEETRKSIPAELNSLAALVQSDPAETNELVTLRTTVSGQIVAMEAARRYYAARAPGQPPPPELFEEKKTRDRVRASLQYMLKLEDEAITPARVRYDRANEAVIASLAGSLGLGCLASILGILLLTSSIGSRIRSLERNANQLGLGATLPDNGSKDELGRLARALAQASASISVNNARLNEAKEDAERANTAKSEFLSRMSHELRTPLNSILGFGQVLTMETLAERQRSCVDHIIKAGRHLLNLIDEVLDISRIETGRLPLSPEPVRVMDCVSHAMDIVRPLAAARSLRLICKIPEQSGDFVLADRQRLQQVLLNLLSNAVKYNVTGGSITISCAEAATQRLLLSVADTGVGISEKDRARLFSPFERLGAERAGIEGTGLGLAVSKRLVEAMGGTIDVASEPGKGSTFTIDLPAAIAPEQFARQMEGAAIQSKPTSGPERTLLYIEDNVANMQLIEFLLGFRPGVRMLPAMQARLGLELACQHRPDLIFLDLHLPDMRGDEVLRRLRADSRTRDIPVVIISADATPGQISRLKAEGAHEYLTKPLDVPQLLATMDRYLEQVAAS